MSSDDDFSSEVDLGDTSHYQTSVTDEIGGQAGQPPSDEETAEQLPKRIRQKHN
jgi:hypothetical protein